MTQEDIIERGRAAQALLHDATFKSFFDEMKALFQESIVNTKPEHRAERETLYFRYNALTDLLGIMQSYVDAAQAIHKLNEQEEID